LGDEGWIARVGNQPGEVLRDAHVALDSGEQHNATVRRPPSKAAVIFFRPIAGKPNVSVVVSDTAGVALSDQVSGVVSTPNP
jgi:hypothetical protein